jgi:DNA invertase Pin-like site-specific DNA recombinase
MVAVLGGLTEFERDLIGARTTEGRERAKARGVKMRRPPKLTPYQKKEAIRRRDHVKETLAEIGKSCNVSGWTISRLMAQARKAAAVSRPVDCTDSLTRRVRRGIFQHAKVGREEILRRHSGIRHQQEFSGLRHIHWRSA